MPAASASTVVAVGEAKGRLNSPLIKRAVTSLPLPSLLSLPQMELSRLAESTIFLKTLLESCWSLGGFHWNRLQSFGRGRHGPLFRYIICRVTNVENCLVSLVASDNQQPRSSVDAREGGYGRGRSSFLSHTDALRPPSFLDLRPFRINNGCDTDVAPRRHRC